MITSYILEEAAQTATFQTAKHDCCLYEDEDNLVDCKQVPTQILKRNNNLANTKNTLKYDIASENRHLPKKKDEKTVILQDTIIPSRLQENRLALNNIKMNQISDDCHTSTSSYGYAIDFKKNTHLYKVNELELSTIPSYNNKGCLAINQKRQRTDSNSCKVRDNFKKGESNKSHLLQYTTSRSFTQEQDNSSKNYSIKSFQKQKLQSFDQKNQDQMSDAKDIREGQEVLSSMSLIQNNDSRRDQRFPQGFFVCTPTASKRRTIRLNQNMYKIPKDRKQHQIEIFDNSNDQQFTFGDDDSDKLQYSFDLQDDLCSSHLNNLHQSSICSYNNPLSKLTLKTTSKSAIRQLSKIKEKEKDNYCINPLFQGVNNVEDGMTLNYKRIDQFANSKNEWNENIDIQNIKQQHQSIDINHSKKSAIFLKDSPSALKYKNTGQHYFGNDTQQIQESNHSRQNPNHNRFNSSRHRFQYSHQHQQQSHYRFNSSHDHHEQNHDRYGSSDLFKDVMVLGIKREKPLQKRMSDKQDSLLKNKEDQESYWSPLVNDNILQAPRSLNAKICNSVDNIDRTILFNLALKGQRVKIPKDIQPVYSQTNEQISVINKNCKQRSSKSAAPANSCRIIASDSNYTTILPSLLLPIKAQKNRLSQLQEIYNQPSVFDQEKHSNYSSFTMSPRKRILQLSTQNKKQENNKMLYKIRTQEQQQLTQKTPLAQQNSNIYPNSTISNTVPSKRQTHQEKLVNQSNDILAPSNFNGIMQQKNEQKSENQESLYGFYVVNSQPNQQTQSTIKSDYNPRKSNNHKKVINQFQEQDHWLSLNNKFKQKTESNLLDIA